MEKDDFLKKLEKLVAHAKSKHNTVDAGEINDFFVGDNLTPEQMDQIYSYLENRNIDVVPVLDEAMLNADPALDDIGLDLDLDDDSFMKDAEDEDIDLAWVPGAFEIPLAAQKLAQSGKYDAVICLGAVIRGSTSHYDLVCNEAAKGIAQVNLQTGVPVTFGVVTTENIEQAIERAGTKAGNKGADAAIAALELANLLPQL